MEDKLNQLFALLCYYYGCQKGVGLGSDHWVIYLSKYLATKEAYCIMTGKTPEEVGKEIIEAIAVK